MKPTRYIQLIWVCPRDYSSVTADADYQLAIGTDFDFRDRIGVAESGVFDLARLVVPHVQYRVHAARNKELTTRVDVETVDAARLAAHQLSKL